MDRNMLRLGGLALGAAAAVTAVTAWAGLDTEPLEVGLVESAPATVRTAPARLAPEHRMVVLSGVTRAVDRADASFTVGGRLGQRRVRLGDRVVAGQVLAVLDAGGFDHAVRGAAASVSDLEARLAQVERDRARVEALGDSVSTAEVERVRTEAQSLRAALDGARAQADESGRLRDEAVLRAPFDGVVAAVLVEPGEAVAPGAPVVRLAGGSGLEVEVQAPERVWRGLRAGQPARVVLPGLEVAVDGVIRSVAGAAGLAGLLPVVVAVDPDPGVLVGGAHPGVSSGGPTPGVQLVAGLTAEVALPVPLQGGLVVPVGAVVDPIGQDPAVFVVDGDRTRKVPVAPSVLIADDVVVTGALRAGDAVVTAGQARLLDGDRVEVLP